MPVLVLCVEPAEVFQTFVEVHHDSAQVFPSVLAQCLIVVARVCVHHRGAIDQYTLRTAQPAHAVRHLHDVPSSSLSLSIFLQHSRMHMFISCVVRVMVSNALALACAIVDRVQG